MKDPSRIPFDEKVLFFLFIFFLVGMFFLPLSWTKDLLYLSLIVSLRLFFKQKLYLLIKNSLILKLSIIFISYYLLTLFWANLGGWPDTLTAIKSSFKLLIFIFVGTAVLGSKNFRILDFFKLLSIAFSIIAVLNIIHFYSGNGFDFSRRLAGIGTIAWFTLAGGVYAIAFLIAIFGVATNEECSPKEKVAYSFLGLIDLVFVALTQSRGPLLAVLVSTACGLLILKKRKITIAVFSLSLASATLWHFTFYPLRKLLERGESYRFEIWRNSWFLAKEKLLFGHGINSTSAVAVGFGTAEHPHNLFLYVLLESGLVGLCLILFIVFISLYASLKRFKRIGPVFLLLILCSVILNLTDGPKIIENPSYQWICFWFPVILAASQEKLLLSNNTDFLST